VSEGTVRPPEPDPEPDPDPDPDADPDADAGRFFSFPRSCAME